jgi:hypothetical protein
VVRSEVQQAGFVLDAEGTFLRNPDDPRDKSSGRFAVLHGQVRAALPQAGLALMPIDDTSIIAHAIQLAIAPVPAHRRGRSSWA